MADMDLTIPYPDAIFNVRVAAIVISSAGHLLLQGDPRVSFLVPPGGRCKLREDSRTALERELSEELGAPFKVGRLAWIIENFFELDGREYHEYTFVYRATAVDEASLLARGQRFPFTDGGQSFYFRWFAPAELEDIEVYPEILKTRYDSLPDGVEHIVVNTLG